MYLWPNLLGVFYPMPLRVRIASKNKELRGSNNGIIDGYHKWLKSRTEGITWLPKLKSLSGKEVEILEES